MNYQESKSAEVSMHALDVWQIIRSRLLVVIVSTLLVFIAACVFTELQSVQYMSKTRFALGKPERTIDVYQGTVSAQGGLSRLLDNNTQLELLKSPANLMRVVDELNLDETWGIPKRSAANRIKGMLVVVPVKRTSLVDLYVYSDEADLAAEIARSIRDQYEILRNEEDQEGVENAISSLKKQIEVRNQLVESKRTELNEIKKKLRFIDLKGAGNWGGWGGGNQALSGAKVVKTKHEMYLVERQLKEIETNIETISKLDGDELIKSIAVIDIPENTVKNHYPKYRDMALQLQMLKDANLGHNHPERKNLRGQMSATKRLLDEGVIQIKRNLAHKKMMLEKSLENVKLFNSKTEEEHITESISRVKFEEIQESYKRLKKSLDDMKDRLIAEEATKDINRISLKVFQEAEPNYFPVKPNHKKNMLVGLIAGLALGLALAFVLEYLDTSMKTVDEVEKYLQLPVIAVIPKGVPLLHKQPGLNPDAEAYRILRTNIEFNRQSADANSITVVSAGAGEGKSTTITNLAYVCAQGGYTALMIDADLRRPKLHTFFDVSNSIGLTNYLTSEMELENVILQTQVDNLFFMPSGVLPTDATAVLNLRKMSDLIETVKSKFDLVLIDSPPILGVSDASVLVSEADLTMIVVQHRKLPRKLIQRVKQSAESVGGNLLGVVLNNVDVNTDTQYQYYTSYYTYYSSANSYVSPEPEPAATESKGDNKNKELAKASEPKTNNSNFYNEY